MYIIPFIPSVSRKPQWIALVSLTSLVIGQENSHLPLDQSHEN